MYIIIIYDVEAKKTTKFHKFLKKRLTWIQNSVFEGEISDAEFVKVKDTMKKFCKNEDSVIIYTFFSSKYLDRVIIGKKIDKEISAVI